MVRLFYLGIIRNCLGPFFSSLSEVSMFFLLLSFGFLLLCLVARFEDLPWGFNVTSLRFIVGVHRQPIIWLGFLTFTIRLLSGFLRFNGLTSRDQAFPVIYHRIVRGMTRTLGRVVGILFVEHGEVNRLFRFLPE